MGLHTLKSRRENAMKVFTLSKIIGCRVVITHEEYFKHEHTTRPVSSAKFKQELIYLRTLFLRTVTFLE